MTLRAASLGPRLHFLDGLRGIAAAMVVVMHVPLFVATPEILNIGRFGNPWVPMFMAVSGFSLLLPAAAYIAPRLPRPYPEFMMRRARRIVPAWIAALCLAVAAGAVLEYFHIETRFTWLPQSWMDLGTHTTLTHSMTRYAGTMLMPGYTLGFEWQLYLLMPALLLIARKSGWLTLLALLGVLAAPIPGPLASLFQRVIAPPFAGPFALGMLGAWLVTHLPEHISLPARAVRSRTETALRVGTVAGVLGFTPLWHVNDIAASWVAGAATAAACTLMARHRASLFGRILGWSGFQSLGRISYSLYLTHFPILALTLVLAAVLAIEASMVFLVLIPPMLALIALVASASWWLFERPFVADAGMGHRINDTTRTDGYPS